MIINNDPKHNTCSRPPLLLFLFLFFFTASTGTPKRECMGNFPSKIPWKQSPSSIKTWIFLSMGKHTHTKKNCLLCSLKLANQPVRFVVLFVFVDFTFLKTALSRALCSRRDATVSSTDILLWRSARFLLNWARKSPENRTEFQLITVEIVTEKNK